MKNGWINTKEGKEHYKNDLLHRDGGHAVEDFDGGKKWYKEGNLHREDGYAVINKYIDKKEYWVSGVKYTDEEFLQFTNKKRLKEFLDKKLKNKKYKEKIKKI